MVLPILCFFTHIFTLTIHRCSLGDRAKEAVLEIRRGMGQFGYMMRSYSGNTTYDDTWDKSNFRGIVSRLSLGDLNRVMYRVDQEERDDKFGFSTYNIPGHGNLCYSGLRGKRLFHVWGIGVGGVSHTCKLCAVNQDTE